jgi:hypothetical protein
MKYLFLTGSFVLLMASCAQKKDKEQAANYHLSGDTVVIPANSNLQSKLKLDTVAEIPYRMSISSAGNGKSDSKLLCRHRSPIFRTGSKSIPEAGNEGKSGDSAF